MVVLLLLLLELLLCLCADDCDRRRHEFLLLACGHMYLPPHEVCGADLEVRATLSNEGEGERHRIRQGPVFAGCGPAGRAVSTAAAYVLSK